MKFFAWVTLFLMPMLAGSLFFSQQLMAQNIMRDSTTTVQPPRTMTEPKAAIVLAAFGTSYDHALVALLGIKNTIQSRYPNTPVRFAFTSNIIRMKWHRRGNDLDYKNSHPQVPAELYEVKNVLGTLADFQNDGYRNIVVQTTLLTHGEEFQDLLAYTDALAGINTLKEKSKPFQKLVVGRPLMGTWGQQYEYQNDIDILANALASDVADAKAKNSALVYMGHGNDHLSTGLYYELALRMNQLYPQTKTYIGAVEGHPNFDELQTLLVKEGVKKVVIRPLMVVAGDHAHNDMVGDTADSWKSMLQNNGINVVPVLKGLGSSAAIQAIYQQHLSDAAIDAGIVLQ